MCGGAKGIFRGRFAALKTSILEKKKDFKPVTSAVNI